MTRIPCLLCVQSNPVVFFDIKLGRYGDATPVSLTREQPGTTGTLRAASCPDHARPMQLGRIEIELKEDVAPKTAENFKQLALAAPGEVRERTQRVPLPQRYRPASAHFDVLPRLPALLRRATRAPASTGSSPSSCARAETSPLTTAPAAAPSTVRRRRGGALAPSLTCTCTALTCLRVLRLPRPPLQGGRSRTKHFRRESRILLENIRPGWRGWGWLRCRVGPGCAGRAPPPAACPRAGCLRLGNLQPMRPPRRLVHAAPGTPLHAHALRACS